MPTPRHSFRCSQHLVTRARKRAGRENVRLSTLLRALLTDYVEGRHPTIQVLQTLQQLAKELHAIGVNLNQAARALNMGERPGRLTPLLQQLAIQVQAAHDRLTPYHVPRTP